MRNLICHRRKNLVTFLTVIFSAMLMNAYMGSLLSYRQQLCELADATPIYCYITNLNGAYLAGLDINERIVDQLTDSKYTRDIAYTVKVNGGVGEIPLNEWYKLGYNVIGANRIDALPDLNYDDITMSGDKKAFFESDENIALFSRDYLEKNNIKVGDEVPFTLYYYQYDDNDVFCHPLDVVTVKIAGDLAKRVRSPEGMALDVIFPAKYLKKVFDVNDIRFFADSLSFYLNNPLELNEAKTEFRSMYLLSRSADALPSHIGLALNMQDTSFISLAGNLMRNINLLRVLSFPLGLLIFALGFFMSFILIKNWEKEYITMRLLGVYDHEGMVFYCAEALVLSAAGVLFGNLITQLSKKAEPNLVYGILIIFASLSGAYAAIFTAKKEMRENSAWK